MANTSTRNLVQINLRALERLLVGNAPQSIAERRRTSKDSIRRLEDSIARQEERLEQTRPQAGESLAHTLQLRASMKDLLLISKRTLGSLEQSAKNLELSWASLE